MKICFIGQTFNTKRGGNEVFANLFRSFQGKHEITVITDRSTETSEYWKTESVFPPAITYFYSLNGYFFAKAAVDKFLELSQKEHFDCVLINQVIGTPILKLKESSVPVVYIIHHPVSVDAELAVKESGILSALGWRVLYTGMKSTQRQIVREFKNILTVSAASQKRISEDYNIGLEKIEVIHNGIDTNFFKKTKSTQEKTVVAVGSYQHPRRGFRYLTKAYEFLSKAGFAIMDVGRRSYAQDDELKKIPRMVLYESVETETLPDLYSEASVMISTSLYEGFGLSVVEALACETPAVAFAGGGIDEVLSMVDPELLCEPRNSKALAEKALRLSKSSDRAERGRRYREVVREHFGLEKMSENYDRYFQKLSSEGTALQKGNQAV